MEHTLRRWSVDPDHHLHCSHCWSGRAGTQGPRVKQITNRDQLIAFFHDCRIFRVEVDDAFAPYYGHLMPVLKQAHSTATLSCIVEDANDGSMHAYVQMQCQIF